MRNVKGRWWTAVSLGRGERIPLDLQTADEEVARDRQGVVNYFLDLKIFWPVEAVAAGEMTYSELWQLARDWTEKAARALGLGQDARTE